MNSYPSEITGSKVEALLYSIDTYDIESGTDLNNVKQPGYHRIASGSVFGTLTNTPYNAVAAGSVLIVVPFAWDASIVQILICNQESSIFIRKYNSLTNTWYYWDVIIQRECNRKKRGSTAERPTIPSNQSYFYIGDVFFDTTLGKPIWYDGDTSDSKSGWVDASGTSV